MNSNVSTAENESRRAASLRRIAIVLRDLPESVARKLLAELAPEARSRVRREMASLVDVDPMERRRALESFTGSLRRGAAREQDTSTATENYTDEITLSHSAHLASAGNHSTSQYRSKTQPNRSNLQPPGAVAQPDQQLSPSLEFLGQVSDDDLLSLLNDEHPQTKAVVLAQIAPARAAALLPRLGGAQRQDLLTRIGRLHTLPEDMLSDIASSFRTRVDRLMAARNPNPLQSLIDAYGGGQPADPATAAKHVPTAAAAVSPRLQAILAEMPATSQTAHNSGPANTTVSPAASTTTAEESAADRLRRITRDDSRQSPAPEPGHAPQQKSNVNLGLSTDDVHQELVRLPPRKLCEALGRVDTRTAILALCGLPNKTADAAISCLPRAQANQVRQRLMSVGSLEIRDIDRAKEAIVAATRVGGQISAPSAAASVPVNSQPRVAVAM
ncbi:FliG C-terminal domain-containing protein [Aporhodopirellula aestuarii]|uniref:Flagellar motor switch protein FliG n=1 Tax=Aporhodopirellula aestuarii TaxID=2950107 RepID=A0ABT0U7M8_9BACT|nr:FliG C-terminal domain-containing protein [Aporhodopirellula aestuarii]MCM2372812.1 flagellar motor switch protein FliG [Aporhodopirellula aestuarii]